MRKKSKKNNHWRGILRYFFLILVGLAAVLLLYQIMRDYLKNEKMFLIKSVVLDPTAPYANSRELNHLKGRSIFNIDVAELEVRLKRQYPQIAYLKVIKRYPDQILVLAKRRNPFAQVFVRNHHVTVDGDGIVISEMGEVEEGLPLIVGARPWRDRPQVGRGLQSANLSVALRIIKDFRLGGVLSAYPISKIDVNNLSKIHVWIGDNLNIILDQEEIPEKLKMLEIVLSQSKLERENIRYIDLRFKEPVVGKK